MHSETPVYPKEVDNEKLIHANRVYEKKNQVPNMLKVFNI